MIRLYYVLVLLLYIFISNYVRKCMNVDLQTSTHVVLAFTISHYAIVEYVNIDTLRMIHSQKLHRVS